MKLDESHFRQIGGTAYCGGCGWAPYYKGSVEGLQHLSLFFTLTCHNPDCRFQGQTFEVYPTVIEGKRAL